MAKVKEFPTEWTLPDPVEDRDDEPEGQAPGPRQGQAVAPVRHEPPLATGAAPGK